MTRKSTPNKVPNPFWRTRSFWYTFIGLCLIAFFTPHIVTYYFFKIGLLEWGGEVVGLGEFGDIFGVLTSFVTAIGILGIFWTLHYNYIDIHEFKNDLDDARRILNSTNNRLQQLAHTIEMASRTANTSKYVELWNIHHAAHNHFAAAYVQYITKPYKIIDAAKSYKPIEMATIHGPKEFRADGSSEEHRFKEALAFWISVANASRMGRIDLPLLRSMLYATMDTWTAAIRSHYTNLEPDIFEKVLEDKMEANFMMCMGVEPEHVRQIRREEHPEESTDDK